MKNTPCSVRVRLGGAGRDEAIVMTPLFASEWEDPGCRRKCSPCRKADEVV